MLIGVLAFQGDFAEHLSIVRELGVKAREVRNVEDLEGIDGLIIPGGESTVMCRFLEMTGVGKEIARRVHAKKKPLAVYGTCAGAIIIAKKVLGKHAVKPLGLMDITIDRNAYGTQSQSFETILNIKDRRGLLVRASFIRAPKITSKGRGVEVISKHNDLPVLVKQGHLLASTFHPEVKDERVIHEMFVRMIGKN